MPAKLQKANEICISLDEFSDFRWRSVFHAVACLPIPVNISSFRLGAKQGSEVSLNRKPGEVLNECSLVYKFKMEVVYGLVTDSLNVIIKARRLYMGKIEGGIQILMFVFGCVCHALSLVIKDMIKIGDLKYLFREVANIVSYFKNVHIANSQLEEQQNKITSFPKKIKTFSPTRWNGCSAMIRSVLEFHSLLAVCSALRWLSHPMKSHYLSCRTKNRKNTVHFRYQGVVIFGRNSRTTRIYLMFLCYLYVCGAASLSIVYGTDFIFFSVEVCIWEATSRSFNRCSELIEIAIQIDCVRSTYSCYRIGSADPTGKVCRSHSIVGRQASACGSTKCTWSRYEIYRQVERRSITVHSSTCIAFVW